MKGMAELIELKQMINQNEAKQVYVSHAMRELVSEFIILRDEYDAYRAKVCSTLRHRADLASGIGLLTSPEWLRETADMLEKA